MEILKVDGSGYGDGSGDGSGYGSGYGSGDGDGYGYGDGSGYGSGYGYGDGSGYGYGDGSGHGSGDGYGYGYGDGSGDGSGHGSGYGYGYGYGDGDGYGYGYGDGYWIAIFKTYFPTIAVPDSFLAYWKSNKNGAPANGGSGTVASVGLIEKIDGPLEICTRHALHATIEPPKHKGERLWLVAMKGELKFQDDKVGALEREILAELKQ